MTIRGIISDQTGTPLFAAAVFESDAAGRLTGAGTTTNTDGAFELKTANNDGFLSVRYLGFQPVTIPKIGNYHIIEMQPTAFDLPPVDIRPEPKRNLFGLAIIGLGLLLALLNDKKQ